MLIVALVLAVIGLAALVTAVVTSNELVAWICIGSSVLGVILLIIDAIRERQRGEAPAVTEESEESDEAADVDDETVEDTYETFDADFPGAGADSGAADEIDSAAADSEDAVEPVELSKAPDPGPQAEAIEDAEVESDEAGDALSEAVDDAEADDAEADDAAADDAAAEDAESADAEAGEAEAAAEDASADAEAAADDAAETDAESADGK